MAVSAVSQTQPDMREAAAAELPRPHITSLRVEQPQLSGCQAWREQK